jgi:hypothetical protein
VLGDIFCYHLGIRDAKSSCSSVMSTAGFRSTVDVRIVLIIR